MAQLDLLRRCLICSARRNQENLNLAKTTVILLQTYIHLRRMAVYTASWEDLSSCVICLVVARESSVITKVHNFSLSSLTCFVKDKQTLKTEDTNWIFSVTHQSGRLFPLKLQSLQQTFQRIIQAYYWRNIFTAFAVGWVVRTKLNSPKNVERFSSLPSIFGYFGKADEKQLNTPPWKDLYLRTSVRK